MLHFKYDAVEVLFRAQVYVDSEFLCDKRHGILLKPGCLLG